MKRILQKTICLLLLSLTVARLSAQQPPFWNEIQQFKKSDKGFPAPPHPILFVGSSSFRIWTDVQNYFPGYTILNRGFGGSTLPDVIRYANDIIFPYQPKQIVIYCGENDFAASDTVTAQTVFNRSVQLVTLIRKQMPNVPIVFVSNKPSPSRQQLMPKIAAANDMIRNFLKDKKATAYADVYHKMLNADGTPMKDIFQSDNLHMNAKGYAIWQKVLQPYLLK